jgi:hypothetical protein
MVLIGKGGHMTMDAKTIAQIGQIMTLLTKQYGDDMAWIVATRKSGAVDQQGCPVVPFLVLTAWPKGWTTEQQDKAMRAALAVFDSVGVDPAFYNYPFSKGATDAHEKAFDDLWKAAEEAASLACWDAFDSEPEPVRLELWAD